MRLNNANLSAGNQLNFNVTNFLSDNGASAEGGLEGHDAVDVNGKPKSIEERTDIADLLGSELYMNHYAASWAWALNY